MNLETTSIDSSNVRQSSFSDQELRALAFRVREHIVNLSQDGGCFVGASLSAVDVLVYLYRRFLNISKPQASDRDYLFLSKGHDVPALYGLFVELGWLEASRLKNHLSPHDHVYWHPNRKIPGVEFHSGSLGHNLPVAVGVAYDLKIRRDPRKVVCVVGDGELNEGSNWEAMLVAKAYNLGNLYIVVDRNEFQANIRTEELIPLEPLGEKFHAFGVEAYEVDGHDFKALDGVFSKIEPGGQRPRAIIAKTVRGKGLPSIEARADRWFCNFTSSEVGALLEELRGGENASLHSETLVVR